MINKNKVLLLLVSGSLCCMNAYAGVVGGKVTDKETNEDIIGASVTYAEGKGMATDLNGCFALDLPNGEITLTISYIGYKTVSRKIHVKDRNEAVNIQMESDNAILGDVTFVGKALHNTDMATIHLQQESGMVMTGVSAQQIKRSQDRDASEVIRRIPGISIIEDKFVMVRGLSQRYNNVWINNAAVPSTESDYRAFSFDIIPSSQLDNVVIVKSQAPEYPADFSGGFILVNTKDVPEQNSYQINAGIGTNTQTMTHPFVLADKASWNYGNRNYRPDFNFSANINHLWDIGSEKLSMLFSANCSDTRKAYLNMDNNLFGTYDVYKDQSLYLRHAIDNQYCQNLRVGGMLNLSLISKSGNNRYEWKNIFNRLENNKYTERQGISNAQGWQFAQGEYNFSARNICNTQLTGKHLLSDETKVDWNIGYAYSDRDMPDRRIWMKTCDGPESEIYFQTGNDITREWTKLKENIYSVGANASHTFDWKSITPELKVGAFAEYRDRDYSTTEWVYSWNPQNSSSLPDRFQYLDIVEVMRPEYLSEEGLYTIDYTNRMNDYQGTSLIASAYAGVNVPIGQLNVYAGLRYEHTDMTLTLNQSRKEWMPADHNYAYNDLFPSLNATYKFDKKHQLRASYGRSINRPEFRELSSSVFYDFDLGSDVKGNSHLKPCYINNVDLRYEWYPSGGEQISFAVFYKNFQHPIEWIYTVTGGTDLCYSYQNADKATSIGMELDVRKDLKFIGLPQWSLNANIALIQSRVNFDDDSRQKDRQMQGQSPYLINLDLFYQSSDRRLNLGLLYNRIGKRLIGVGRNASASEQSANVPDCYEMPRNALDFSASWKCWKSMELKLSVRDILNEQVLFKQTTDVILTNGETRTRDEITKRYRPGVGLQMSVGYTF